MISSTSIIKMSSKNDDTDSSQKIFTEDCRSVSLVSLEAFDFQASGYPTKRDSSYVSLEDDCYSYDDCSVFSDIEPITPPHQNKRIKLLKKSVRFVDMEISQKDSYLPLLQTRMIHPISNDFQDELFWSKKELVQIQSEAKLVQATDPDVQEYVQAFRHIQELVTLSGSDLAVDSSADYDLMLDGLRDGWRGLECYGSSLLAQKQRTRNIIQTILASQNDPTRLADVANSLSAPSVAWSVALGVATHETVDTL